MTSQRPSTLATPEAGARLMRDVELLSGWLGERHDGSGEHHAHLRAAADHIYERLTAAGWSTRLQPFGGEEGRVVENVQAERLGARAPEEIVVVGAHYDTIRGGPGAEDNATGVAAILALAAELGGPMDRTVRIVAFANEEHPHTRRRTMGSLVHARACRAAGERVVAMLSLECLGFHVSHAAPKARRDALTLLQRIVPFWTTGAFVVSNLRSMRLADTVASSLCATGGLPIHRVTAPGFLPLAKSSDHWSFWKNGYPAIMITDGAPLRYRHYHRRTDTAEHLDPMALAALARGASQAVDTIASTVRFRV